VANNGQQQQFDNQRAAELQDLRIAAYASYLRANSRWVIDPDSKQLRGEALAAETQVEYESVDHDVDRAAWNLFHVVDVEEQHAYGAARRQFIKAAGSSLDAG
jgi:hypothetical protein